MKNVPVGLVRCEEYTEEAIETAMQTLLKSIDGLSFLKPKMKVGIKVNLVAGKDPAQAATTNPLLVKALCRELVKRGAEVIVGDSPGGLYTAGYVNGIYRLCKMDRINEPKVQLNQNFSVKEARYQEAAVLKTFSYTGWLDEVDVLINFCKLKTHAMMKMTCGVKNLFGTIPGIIKPEYHMRFPKIEDFANMMVDLNEYFKPSLTIVDAIDCMEGNGPTAGEVRHMGALFASKSPYMADMVAAELIGLKRGDVQTIAAACERGLGPADIKEVTIIGESIESLQILDFKTDMKKQNITFSSGNGIFSKVETKVVQSIFATRPNVTKKECIGCRKCYEICPAKAIEMKNNKPVIQRKMCIHCFCCQEFCPKGAMKVQHTFLGKIIEKMQ